MSLWGGGAPTQKGAKQSAQATYQHPLRSTSWRPRRLCWARCSSASGSGVAGRRRRGAMNDDDESARNASLGDIWSTIEDQGLADLAAEVGIVSGVEPGDGDGLGGSAHMHYATDATALVGAASPPRVHVPHCSSSGPSVPAELAATLSSAGEPAIQTRVEPFSSYVLCKPSRKLMPTWSWLSRFRGSQRP